MNLITPEGRESQRCGSLAAVSTNFCPHQLDGSQSKSVEWADTCVLIGQVTMSTTRGKVCFFHFFALFFTFFPHLIHFFLTVCYFVPFYICPYLPQFLKCVWTAWAGLCEYFWSFISVTEFVVLWHGNPEWFALPDVCWVRPHGESTLPQSSPDPHLPHPQLGSSLLHKKTSCWYIVSHITLQLTLSYMSAFTCMFVGAVVTLFNWQSGNLALIPELLLMSLWCFG